MKNLILILALALTACGGGSGTADPLPVPKDPVVKTPIALQSTSYLNMKNVGLSRINFPDSLRTVTPDQPLAWTAGDFFKNGTLDIFTAKQNYSMDTNKYPTANVISSEEYKLALMHI
jgi:hypothetical protein